MGGDWDAAPLDELVDEIIDRRGVTPLKLGSVFVANGYRVISAKAIKGRRVDLSADEPRFVNEDTYYKWMKSPLRAGDVILTSEAPLGEPAYVSKRVEWCLGQRLFAIRSKKSRLHGRYLFYALQSEQVRHDLLSRATGTTAQGIRQTELRPTVGEQQAIAHILGTLDDKIELNRRMNETLEAMARALFKSWFVDFDPVRAKAEGRDSGLPKPLADLFPDSFEDSDLGEIPKSWQVGSLEALASIEGGKQLPTEECGLVGAFPVFGANGIMGFAERATHGGVVIAFGRVGAYCGSVHWTYGGAWINNNASSVVPTAWREYVLQLMLEADFEGMRRGSAQPFIPNSSLASMPVLRPTRKVLDAFGSSVAPLRLREQATLVESRSLAALRDTLLPKLISGELRVKGAERFLGGEG